MDLVHPQAGCAQTIVNGSQRESGLMFYPAKPFFLRGRHQNSVADDSSRGIMAIVIASHTEHMHSDKIHHC
jgi:hypothetical protein